MKKTSIILSIIILNLGITYCQVDSIYNINISQRTDGSKTVDIYYGLEGPEYYYNIDLEVSFNNGINYYRIDSIAGDTGIGVQPGLNKHIIWYAGKEFSGQYNDSVLIKILASTEYLTCGISKMYHEGFEYGTVEHKGRCWLDRNLGAIRIAESYDDTLSFGNVYQWGRLSDGHQILTSDTTSDLSDDDIPGHDKFIITSDSPYDWRVPQNDNLWQGAEGINNPCPPEFMVPTELDWSNAAALWELPKSDPFSCSLKLPRAWYRSRITGGYSSWISEQYYWSSTIDQEKSKVFYFWLYVTWGFIDGSRANGSPIRCIMENNPTLVKPSYPNPTPYSIGISELEELSWFHDDQNVEFDVFLGQTPEPPLVAHLVTEMEYEPGILEYNATYYWRIVAIYPDGLAISSDLWSFTTREFTCGSSLISHQDTLYGTILYKDRCWLKRNLGAVDTATSFDDFDGFGDYYQWGRLTDGHQNQSSLDSSELSSSNIPGHDKFILNGSPPYDWRSPKNDSLWNGDNSINNPCPQGWHVPTEFEWNEASLNWVNRDDAFDSLLLPSSGYRSASNGNFLEIIYMGRYWTRTINGIYSKYFYFNADNSGVTSSGRASGYPVRCIKDEPILLPYDPYPPDDTILQTNLVEFSWLCYDPEGENLTYDIYFGTLSEPSLVAEGQTGLTYNPGILDYDVIYYWKIIAKDPHGSLSEGEIWNFTIEPFICGETDIIDIRDEQTYSTVMIDNLCWMAENLNIGTRIEGVNDQSNNGTIEKYCYNDIEDSCIIYGGLYQWNEMMSYSSQGGIQGICPSGWHIPQWFECNDLFNFLGDSSACKLMEEGTEHWIPPNSCATNESGFTALPGGNLFYHSFGGIGINAKFWTSTIDEEPQYADYWVLGESINVYYYILKRSSGLSVRCVKSWSQCGDALLDSRNFKIYNTVQIGNQCWMAENLNIGDRIDGVNNPEDNGYIEKYCYNDLEDSCHVYGGLYQWEEMMDYTNDTATQGICPDGWHIPTDYEWCVLENFVDDGTVDCGVMGYRGTNAGLKLKSIFGWMEPGNGNDNYGFSAFPGGYRSSADGGFYRQSRSAYVWTSTISSPSNSYRRRLEYDNNSVGNGEGDFTGGRSVRCIKN